MKPELHLIVLWEFARAKEAEITADLPRHVTILDSRILAWPVDAERAFGAFYGAKLKTARGKVAACGGGEFRVFVVRDEKPRYGWKNTSRGLELVNLRMFAIKSRYRAWTGGGHKVHTSNTPEEARRDIYLLTGHKIDEWANGDKPRDCAPLPWLAAPWRDLRTMFEALNETTPYAVIRNFETLPDKFDPSLHGDIDILVENAGDTAALLGARKVFKDSWRVHYEVKVGHCAIRLDLRYVGDGYYCREWETAMLSQRVKTESGVFIPSPQDAFFAIVYHALYQKEIIAPDYMDKTAALARKAGIDGDSWACWHQSLCDFLEGNRYAATKPIDKSVFFNECLAQWQKIADELARFAPLEGVRPEGIGVVRGTRHVPSLLLKGRLWGEECYVKYAAIGPKLIENEWKFPGRLAKYTPDNCIKPLFWHMIGEKGAFIVSKTIPGERLSSLLASDTPIPADKAAKIALDCLKISNALLEVGIIHRDIRPDNLIVDGGGNTVLMDFQYALDAANPVETGFVAARHEKILSHLGGDSRVADGAWNDREAMRKCVQALPPTPERERVIAELSKDIEKYTHVAVLPRRMRKSLLKQYVMISCKNAIRRMVGQKAKGEKTSLHLKTTLTKWRFA